MPLTTAELNNLVDTQTARLVYVSLHTADPGSSGASEASGGSYARKQVTWPAASSGSATGGQVTFDANAGTYTHFGYWSASTAGTFRGGGALSPGSQTLSSAGQIKFTGTFSAT